MVICFFLFYHVLSRSLLGKNFFFRFFDHFFYKIIVCFLFQRLLRQTVFFLDLHFCFDLVNNDKWKFLYAPKKQKSLYVFIIFIIFIINCGVILWFFLCFCCTSTSLINYFLSYEHMFAQSN